MGRRIDPDDPDHWTHPQDRDDYLAGEVCQHCEAIIVYDRDAACWVDVDDRSEGCPVSDDPACWGEHAPESLTAAERVAEHTGHES